MVRVVRRPPRPPTAQTSEGAGPRWTSRDRRGVCSSTVETQRPTLSQLMPVKEVFADFAKAMLDNTITLENRTKSFEKYSPRTLEDTPKEPQEPNEPSFILRSARVKLELNYSKALANDTEIIRLKRESEECKKDFTTKVY